MNDYKQQLSEQIKTEQSNGNIVKRMIITAVLRDIKIIEKSTAEVVEEVTNQTEKAVDILRLNLAEEYPNCVMEVSDSEFDRVLAQEVTGERYDPSSTKETVPMVLNAGSFLKEKLVKGTSFLIAATDFSIFADSKGYKTFAPIMHNKVWGQGEADDGSEDEDISIFGVQLAKSNRKFSNQRLSRTMKRVS